MAGTCTCMPRSWSSARLACIEEAEASAGASATGGIWREDTLLLVVGRGSSDPDANADVGKVSRILAEGMGFGWSAVSFIGVTTPLLPDALERCQRMGFSRIVVFSFFLFTGILEKRIQQMTRDFAAQQHQVEVLYAGYLQAHPLLFEVFAERAEEVLDGSPNMNCELCKYRVSLPGFAEAVGQPQMGHHHHVRARYPARIMDRTFILRISRRSDT